MKKLNIEKQTIIHLLLYNFLFISICFTQNTERHPKSNHNYNSFNRDQEFVYHTIGNMWFSWDNYGNAGDQSCSALYPSFNYPGGGNLTYQCRGGYWVLSYFAENDDYLEGTTGVYELSIGTEPISHSAGWANPNDAYSKEPWISEIIYETEGGIHVIMKHYSWSCPGTTNYFYRVGDPLEEFDFDDFVLEEIYLVYNGSSMTSPPDTLDELVFGMKSDFDNAWNVPNPDWDYAFWTDDHVDWDNETQTTFGYDGDDPGFPSNDFGIDDPGREYRGVKIGQTWIESPDAFIDGQIIPAEDAITHMWWTSDQDPQTTIERFEIATRVHSGFGDSKGNVPEPMDARYLQAYGPWKLGLGDTIKIITAKVQASGVWSMKNAAKAASKAYAWNLTLPKPPPAPQMDAGMNAVLSDRSIKIWWKNPNEGAIDPDLGFSDFAGYRIYRSVADSSWDAASIYEVEGLTPDEGSDIDEGTTFAGNQVGPFVLMEEITVGEVNNYLVSGTSDEYEWIDTTTIDFKKHWYYVASFDTGGETDVFSGITYVPSLESGRTLVYPMEDEENGITSTIPYLFAGSTTQEIFIDTDSIDFGDVEIGDTATYVFIIYNMGNIQLEVYDINTETPFYVDYSENYVNAGELIEIQIRFSPEETGEYSNNLTIYSNDNDEEEVTVQLTGTAVGLSVDWHQIPEKFALHQNHPNPFNPVTTLRYDLPEGANVNITIYNMMGRKVSTLVSSQETAGFKSVQWNATNDKGSPVSAGLYLYTIQAGEFRQTRKMVLLK